GRPLRWPASERGPPVSRRPALGKCPRSGFLQAVAALDPLRNSLRQVIDYISTGIGWLLWVKYAIIPANKGTFLCLFFSELHIKIELRNSGKPEWVSRNRINDLKLK